MRLFERGWAGDRRVWQRLLFTAPAKAPGIDRLLYDTVFPRRATVADYQRRFGFPDGHRIPEDHLDAQVWSSARRDAHRSALPFITGELRYDIAPLVERCPTPALMPWGGDEWHVAPEVVARTQALNPAVAQQTVPGARSALVWTHPEVVAAAVDEVGQTVAERRERVPGR